MIRQYIGARYVPKFYENSQGTTAWESGVIYEPLTIVTYNGNSYTSKKPVPAEVGDPSANTSYWVATGVFNEQLASLSAQVSEFKTKSDIYVTPEEFGAVGDGETNDSAAVNEAIATGKTVIFDQSKTYVCDIVTPNDRYVNIDFNGCVIVGSITVTTTLPNINYSDKNRHIFSNGNIRATGNIAVLVHDDNYRTIFENMTITALKTGIQCGTSGTRPSDVHIINCFINAAHGYEDSTEYGINCIGTDNKISGCLIFGFKCCIRCRSLEVIENCHFLYRGDFSTNWNVACAIECSNAPIISNCYFDTYKTAIRFISNCYPNINSMVFYSWREDTGAINGLIDFNGFTGFVYINGASINLTNVTTFKMLSIDLSSDVNANIYMQSTVNNVFCSRWSAVYNYDVMRKSVRTFFYNNQIAGGDYAMIGRFIAPLYGTYIVSIYMTNGVRHDIKVAITSNSCTAEKEVGDESSLVCTCERDGHGFTLYAKFNSAWSFMPAKAFASLEELGLFAGVSNPVIKSE